MSSMATARELVTFFVPESSPVGPGAPPVVNESLALFPSAGVEQAHAAPAKATAPRVWDNEQGFFVTVAAAAAVAAATAQEHQRQHQQQPAAAVAVAGTPPRKQRQKTNRQKRTRKSSPDSTPQRSAAQRTSVASSPAMPDTPAALVKPPRTAESSPAPKRFAGSSFEAASPDPTSLPIPKFSQILRSKAPEQETEDRLGVSPSPPAEFLVPVMSKLAPMLTANEVVATDLRRMLRI